MSLRGGCKFMPCNNALLFILCFTGRFEVDPAAVPEKPRSRVFTVLVRLQIALRPLVERLNLLRAISVELWRNRESDNVIGAHSEVHAQQVDQAFHESCLWNLWSITPVPQLCGSKIERSEWTSIHGGV